jgi:hypothetical protein
MPKIFNDPSIVHRLNEDIWFVEKQRELLAMVNTDFGRDLFCIPKDFPQITSIAKNYIQAFIGYAPGGRKQYITDVRVGAKWANVIRSKWDQYKSFERYFMSNDYNVPMSPLTRYARSVVATTTTVYPDPSPTTTTVDGPITYDTDGIGSGWDLAHDATSAAGSLGGAFPSHVGNSNFYSAGTLYNHPSGRHVITRAAYLFDTSSIPDTDTIDSATFSVYVTGTANDDNDGDDFLSVVSSTPALNTDLVAADYDQIGDAIDDPTEGIDTGNRADITGISTSAYLDFALNATGLGWVSTTGITKLGTREGHDILDNPMTNNGGNTYNRVNIYFADQTGTTTDPKLVITHSAAPTNFNTLLMMGVGT